jgi:ankyrin repeat protein
MKYIKLFEQHVEDWNNKLLDYSWSGNLNSVKQSIKNGANVNCKDNYGWTQLHYSSSNGYLNIV